MNQLLYSGPDDHDHKNDLMIWKYGFEFVHYDYENNATLCKYDTKVDMIHEYPGFVIFRMDNIINAYTKFSKDMIHIVADNINYSSAIHGNNLYIYTRNKGSKKDKILTKVFICDINTGRYYDTDSGHNKKKLRGNFADTLKQFIGTDLSYLVEPKILYDFNRPSYQITRSGFIDLKQN